MKNRKSPLTELSGQKIKKTPVQGFKSQIAEVHQGSEFMKVGAGGKLMRKKTIK
jgi:hypothetical protein